MEILSKKLDMRRGCVFLLDKKTGEIKIVVAYGLTREEIQRGKYRIGEGIVGKVIDSGLPMFIPDIEKEPKFLNKNRQPTKQKRYFILMCSDKN